MKRQLEKKSNTFGEVESIPEECNQPTNYQLPTNQLTNQPTTSYQLALEHPTCATPAEAVRFDLDMAKKHGAMTLAYLARAGWRLACEKQGVGHGAWLNLCEGIGISADTAGRYIKFYYSTVGEHLRSLGTSRRLAEELTDEMIEAATSSLESKTATGAMIELGIVKRPPGWGGEREGAGRKAKDDAAAEAAELDEIANNPALLFAAAKGPLDELWRLHRERDLFARLGDEELAQVADVLADLSQAATAAHKLRRTGMAR